MRQQRNGALSTLLVGAVLASWNTQGTLLAQKSTPTTQDKVALGERDVKQLLVLMEADKNGKISKQEFMTFMEAEFKRLDKNRDGNLDVKQLTRSKIQARQRPSSSAEQK